MQLLQTGSWAQKDTRIKLQNNKNIKNMTNNCPYIA